MPVLSLRETNGKALQSNLDFWIDMDTMILRISTQSMSAILSEHHSLKNLSTLRLDATARYFADIREEDGLREIFSFVREHALPYLVIGG